MLSIIIPVLNEYERVRSDAFLSYCNDLQTQQSELIFVDGGSGDGTYECLQSQGFKVVVSQPGRASQMNMGAAQAKGDTLLFLHCDTRIQASIENLAMALHGKEWGFFTLQLDNNGFLYRCIAKGIRFRARAFSVATGDQGIFVSAKLFQSVGGYPQIELMEDVALSRSLKRVSSPAILSIPIIASARRWQKSGAIKMIVLMWGIQLAYKLGVSPKQLNLWYR
ncbi:MAG: TIGR04283 family arsenosugar biosynthesis glycosyltransferase [Agarilytica sp.]